MRLFIGIPLPDDLINILIKAQSKIAKTDARMTLVKKENLHITLLFIGEANPLKIIEGLDKVKYKPFKAIIKGLSFFKNNGYIRVIHAPVLGVDLFKLHDLIINALSVSDKKFSPHITLSRVKFVKSTNELSRVCHDILINKELMIKQFNLYSSILTSQGPVYKIIKSYEL